MARATRVQVNAAGERENLEILRALGVNVSKLPKIHALEAALRRAADWQFGRYLAAKYGPRCAGLAAMTDLARRENEAAPMPVGFVTQRAAVA